MKVMFTRALAAIAAMSGVGTAQAHASGAAAYAIQPIAGAGNWVLRRQLPGVQGPVCTIRTEGPEANTTIVLNNVSRPVMMVGSGDWSGLTGTAEAALSIDGAAAVQVNVHMVHNLVLFTPSDEQMRRLRGAQTIDWSFPFGRFRAGIAGLGAALDALTACRPGAAG